MPLIAMQNTPGMDEHMRASNEMVHAQHIGTQFWTGEQNLNSLGLGDMDPSGIGGLGAGPTEWINALSYGATNVIGAVNARKAAKRAGGRAAPQQQPDIGGSAGSSGGGGGLVAGMDNTTLLMIAGGVVVVGLILYSVTKKKRGGAAIIKKEE